MKNKELLTVGELAKEMDVTVRTLQYYDKEGLLKPSSKSEGGRRLYTKKDMIKLHQILSLKYLGFSLEEIKDKILSVNKPSEVAKILEGQAMIINQQIENLKVALAATEALHKEVLQIEKVDFSKFADIISLLRQNNENYWVIKLFDDKLTDHFRDRFTNDPQSGERLFNKYLEVLDKAVRLKKEKELPISSKGIEMAKEWWDMINEFTDGDLSILPELMKFNENKDRWDNEIGEKQKYIDKYLDEALAAYFQSQNISIPELEV
ncbi:MAG: MerR family transcriptional regulator [Clostridium sp.]